MIKIAPSLLAADIANLESQIKMVENAGAEYLHLDIMDAHFVPNLSFGPCVIESIRKHSKMVYDVHLMMENPIDYIDPFAKAGADIITFHVEAKSNLDDCINKIHSHNIKAGIVIKPDTDVKEFEEYYDKVEMVLVMSVYPGFGGQKFMPEVLEKVTYIREKMGKDFDIEIDGGVGPANAEAIIKAGANVLVAGSAVFGAENPSEVIKAMKSYEK
ncbi:MAG: ribulose-phosphate 3-epimerase [Clostridia bacterium]|nr:ribulose-phosphate 3-epimerase [Clostridia bacterium]